MQVPQERLYFFPLIRRMLPQATDESFAIVSPKSFETNLVCAQERSTSQNLFGGVDRPHLLLLKNLKQNL